LTEADMISLAFDEGFAAAAVVDTDKIVFDPMFRPYCEENLCGQYGVNYSCPPDCGTPEEMKQRILTHKKALVLQTIWEIPDFTDKPVIKAAKGSHNRGSLKLLRIFRENGIDCFPAGASGCALCTPCALSRGEPCTYPDLRYSCLSAYCIFVKKLADEAGMEYSPGDGLVAFFGMILFD